MIIGMTFISHVVYGNLRDLGCGSIGRNVMKLSHRSKFLLFRFQGGPLGANMDLGFLKYELCREIVGLRPEITIDINKY